MFVLQCSSIASIFFLFTLAVLSTKQIIINVSQALHSHWVKLSRGLHRSASSCRVSDSWPLHLKIRSVLRSKNASNENDALGQGSGSVPRPCPSKLSQILPWSREQHTQSSTTVASHVQHSFDMNSQAVLKSPLV